MHTLKKPNTETCRYFPNEYYYLFIFFAFSVVLLRKIYQGISNLSLKPCHFLKLCVQITVTFELYPVGSAG